MKRVRQTVEVSEPLWKALETMSAETGIPLDALVNQAFFAFARSAGYVVPTAVKLAEAEAGAVPGVPVRPEAGAKPSVTTPPPIPAAAPAPEPSVVVAPEASVAAPAGAAPAERGAVEEAEDETPEAPPPATKPPEVPRAAAAARDAPLEKPSKDEDVEEDAERGGDEAAAGDEDEARAGDEAGGDEADEDEAGEDEAGEDDADEDDAGEDEADDAAAAGAGERGAAGPTSESAAGDEDDGADEEDDDAARADTAQRPVEARGKHAGAGEGAPPDEPPADEGDRTMLVNRRERFFLEVPGREPALVTGERFVVGAHCDLVLSSNRVSREHAVVLTTAQGVFVEDLGSSNGTWFNKEKLKGRLRLEDGMEVSFGNERVLVHVEG